MKSVLIQQVYPGLGFEPMLELTRAHHKVYCKRHGIDYLPIVDNYTHHDPQLGAYAKIALIKYAMNKGYENIIWLDADTLIVDTDVSVVDAVQPKKIGACWHRIPQLHHWNVGALYVHNSLETREFINQWLEVYPPPKDGWNEQGVFNRMGRGGDVVVTLSDKWNATINVSMVPDAVVMGFHGAGDAKERYELMKATMNRLFPAQEAAETQGMSEVTNDT